MRKISFSNILVAIGLFGTLLFIPYIADVIITGIEAEYSINVPLYFNLDRWYEVMSIALPAALTYLVIRQSEQQQKESEVVQTRMERINKSLLEMNLKSKIGYFIPKIYIEDHMQDSRKQHYPHKMDKHIVLVNEGDDNTFIHSVDLWVCGKKKNLDPMSPICFLCKPPFNEMLFECYLSDEELKMSQIDMEIVIFAENTYGYMYRQILQIGFACKNNIGIVNSFNMELKEGHYNAN